MLKRISSYTFVLLVMVSVMSACKKDYESAESIDGKKIETYLSNNKINATKDPAGTGFYYQIVQPGTGLNLFKDTDSVLYSVTVKSLLNGNTYFTSSANANLGTYVGYSSQLLGINIKAIQSTLKLIKPGGSVRILVPSYLAFGKNGNSVLNIPSNELLDIVVSTYAETKQVDLDQKKILEFIAAKGLTATRDDSGVYYIVTQEGPATGAVIDMASSLTLNYTARFFNGTVFDSTTDGTFKVELTGVIDGWSVLKKFKKGTKVRLLVPSFKAYGTTGRTDQVTGATIIERNANLDFEIEIADVVN
ncbi:MAG: FKBP-type peptidyl-prolyl cis-trans isomerase [Bacteroidota bacterium]